MKKYNEITREEVWRYLTEGRKVFAVIFYSPRWCRGLKTLWEGWQVSAINDLVKNDRHIARFFLEVDDEVGE